MNPPPAEVAVVEGVGAELVAGAHDAGRVLGAEPDRVDADVPVGGLLGGDERVDALGVGPVGQQHDDVGDVVAVLGGCRARRSAWASTAAPPPGRTR